MVTEMGATDKGRFVAETTVPSATEGLRRPAPGAKIAIDDPRAAGCAGELTDKSPFKIAPCPDALVTNMAGAAALTGSVAVNVAPPGAETRISVVDLPATANGTTALIWPAGAYNSGARVPSKPTVSPVSDVSTFPDCSTSPSGADGPMLLPKIVTNSPGAIAELVKLAALTTAVTPGTGSKP